MTTGTNRKPPTAMLNWALAQIELRPDMPNDEARRIVFKRLGDIDFMPPFALDSALRTAGIAPSDGAVHGPVFASARRAVAENLRTEVESFAAKFFSLPPDLRTAQYRQLIEQAAGMPAVTARLEDLRPALDSPCELPTDQPREVIELLDQVRRLFVLPRQERAGRRLAFLHECRENWSQWQRAANVVRLKMARIASLEPMLFRELCAAGNREKVRKTIAKQRRSVFRKSRRSYTTTRRSSGGSRWWIYIVGAVVLAGLRASSDNHNRSYRPAPVRLSQPWSTQQVERRPGQDSPHTDLQKQMLRSEVNRAVDRGELSRDLIDRLLAPPEKAASPPEKAASPPTKTSPPLRLPDGAEVHVVKTPEEAREIVRQAEKQAQAGNWPKGAPVEIHIFTLDQAKEALRQLREQRAQHGPNSSRDAAIEGLQKAIDEGTRNSQKQP